MGRRDEGATRRGGWDAEGGGLSVKGRANEPAMKDDQVSLITVRRIDAIIYGLFMITLFAALSWWTYYYIKGFSSDNNPAYLLSLPMCVVLLMPYLSRSILLVALSVSNNPILLGVRGSNLFYVHPAIFMRSVSDIEGIVIERGRGLASHARILVLSFKGGKVIRINDYFSVERVHAAKDALEMIRRRCLIPAA